MNEEIIIAGFGGQGVLSMGKILAYSGIMKNLEVSWMPSYGPEMRGGTANVTVILSDDRISSPILTKYDTAIILNQQSLDKFESMIKKGGILLYDTNGITRHPQRTDIHIYKVEASQEALKMGASRTFNMIVLGAYLKIRPQTNRIRCAVSNAPLDSILLSIINNSGAVISLMARVPIHGNIFCSRPLIVFVA